MAERDVRDSKGSGFKLKSFVWRSEPSTSPLTGRSIRCVVGTDEDGCFRLARRMGRIGEERFEMVFDREAYVSKEEAIRASREMRVDFIRGEAEDYLQGNKRGGLELFRVDSMEGWRTGAALGRTPESRVRKLFEEFGGEREAPPKSLSRARRRGIDR